MLGPSAPLMKVQGRTSRRQHPIQERRPFPDTSTRAHVPAVLVTPLMMNRALVPMGCGCQSDRGLLPVIFSCDSAHLFHLNKTINITIELGLGGSRWGLAPTSPCPTPCVGGDGLCGIIDLGGHRPSGDRPTSQTLACLHPTQSSVVVPLDPHLTAVSPASCT